MEKINRRQPDTRKPPRPSTDGRDATPAVRPGPVVPVRALSILAAVFLCAQHAVFAGADGDDHEVVALAANAAAAVSVAVVASAPLDRNPPVKPWIHNSMAPNVRAKLEAGFELAVERVREIESCRDLFGRLGVDGLETLATGLYFPVDTYHREMKVCGRNTSSNWGGANNLAYIEVGTAPTMICKNFAWVSTETAAVTVIHEALHHAGLTEKPLDRTAMTSTQITRMVRRACEF